MHKPIRIIKDDPRIRLTQQVNLVSALRVALLMSPPSHPTSPASSATSIATDELGERELFHRIAGLSYAGDPRMVIPGAENPRKVGNIVDAQADQFRELYARLGGAIPGVVRWAPGKRIIEVWPFCDRKTCRSNPVIRSTRRRGLALHRSGSSLHTFSRPSNRTMSPLRKTSPP